MNTYNFPPDIYGHGYGCTIMPNSFYFDARYQDLGYAVNEYSLRQENGINDIYSY